MKIVRMVTMVAIVLGMNMNADAMGWSKLKFWKKKDVACVDVCVEDCIDSCIDADCGKDSCWSTLHRKLFATPKHWLSDVCRGTCCNVNLQSCCEDSCVPDFCCEETCIGGDCVDLCTPCDKNRRLAQLIYTSQTACEPRDRKKAVHRIGSRFDCRCQPEVMCALTDALKDCNAHVRAEAADEIGDQLRKRDCCCSPYVVQALKCALNDQSRHVRRESAQALRRCGVKVCRFSWLRRDNCIDGCVDDGCVDDGCVDDGCVNTCCIDDACVSSNCTADNWIAAPEVVAPEVTAPRQKKVAPKPKAKKPVKLPQLKKIQPKKVKKSPKKLTPVPKPSSKVKPKKDKYVPQDDATSLIIPSIGIQELLGAR